MGAGGDDLAVLLDGGLLDSVEIIEQALPFGLEAPGLAQAGQFLGQNQGEEGAEDMAADGGIGLMEDRAGVEGGLGGAEQALGVCQSS